MKFADWKRCFTDLDICQIHDDYVHTSINVSQKNHEQNFNFVKVNVSKQGEYFFSVVQKSARFYTQNDKYSYSFARVCVLKNNSTDGSLNLEYITGEYGGKRDIDI